MRRLLTTSALVALALCVTNASGQPPGGGAPQPPPKAADKKADAKLGDPTDAAIAAALAHDADVKMARAKIQLAEAELAKARQAVTLKVVTLRTKIDQFKLEVASAQVQYDRTLKLVETARVSQAELALARDKLDAAKAALALVEAELKLLTGGATDKLAAVAVEVVWDDATVRRRYVDALVELQRAATPAGAIPDRIRAALDKPVTLGAKGESVTFEQALEAFKKAGLDVPVRNGFKFTAVASLGEELPVGAWLQLFADGNPNVRIVVREYGLLVTLKSEVPPDAPTVTEFWKQKPAAKPEGKK